MRAVAGLPCIVCTMFNVPDSPAEVHHIGDGAERSDWLVIPLCVFHHRGPQGFHGLGERAFNARYKTSELELLGKTIERLTP